jgi:2-hydroxy-6-oxonona-2,4-dienedioate hydrolase
MVSQAVPAKRTDPNLEQYREAERALWEHYGLEPVERFVEIEEPQARLRMIEVGWGEPTVFIPGTPGTGPYWGALLRELRGVRALLIDRPGWGMSSPIDYSTHRYPHVVAQVLAGVLDASGLDRVNVVGHSIGNVWALRLAAAHPERVKRVALIGGGPVVSEIVAPKFIKLLASPLGAVMVRLPQKAGQIRANLRQAGHAATLDAGRVPDAFVEWRVAFHRLTNSMRHEREMVRSLVGRGGWRPGLTFDGAELAEIRPPVLWIYGTADPVGSAEVWQRAVDLLPNGELRLIEGAGHLPWLDDPQGVAAPLDQFLVG